MVLEAINSQTYNSSLSHNHEEGLSENLHYPERMSNSVLFQILEGMAMNRGIRCYSDDLEGKPAALEHLEREHKPWQQSSFQELLAFPLCSGMDESAYAISSDISNQQRVQHNANTTTGCIRNSPNHLAQSQIQLFEPESCITHVSESCSPVKTETKPDHSSSDAVEEGVSSATREPNSSTTVNSLENCAGGASEPRTSIDADPTSQLSARTDVVRERRKRKRSKACKNIEEVESQRMTHIAVERNRRKQMNDHLTVLRSLMPGSYIQRGDQASIIGGAIDFVKELEQLLQSLQAQKRRRECEEGYSPISPIPFNGFFLSPQYTSYSAQWNSKYIVDDLSYDPANELIAENKSAIADIEVTVIETHASLKVLSRKRPGQLLKTIAALQGLHLTILHLNITTIDQTVLYSFNVKIEDECQLASADEIATAVHRIFNIIHSNAIN